MPKLRKRLQIPSNEERKKINEYAEQDQENTFNINFPEERWR